MPRCFEDIYDRAANAPASTWDWFNSLNREEWVVVLFVVCAAGFVGMLGFQGKRL